ncbi:MAG: antirestriction protein ArdA [Pseudomonadota bacterium]
MTNPFSKEGLDMEGSTENTEIRIYVACLAAYNSGILHGAWIDAEQDAYSIYVEVKDMLGASPIAGAEEWAIHDYEGFGGVQISEWEGFEEVSKIAAFISEHGALGGKLLSHYDGLEEAEKAIDDRYASEYESLADFARSMTDETGTDIPDNLAFYIDYEAMGRDLAISDVLRSKQPLMRCMCSGSIRAIGSVHCLFCEPNLYLGVDGQFDGITGQQNICRDGGRSNGSDISSYKCWESCKP